MGFWRQQLIGATNPARDAAWQEVKPRKGFFTDTSICIGCKACEVACKEWNHVPTRSHGRERHGGVLGLSTESYDNTGHLGADTWRHVAFIEQGPEQLARARRTGSVDLGMPRVRPTVAEPVGTVAEPVEATPSTGSGDVAGPGSGDVAGPGSGVGFAEPDDTLPPVRWLMSSDVCKHCTHAGCLDVCPTGALFRTEYGTVVVQPDVCNGCGYCVGSCPFGVIGRRENGLVELADGSSAKPPNAGVAQKCTLCYDRIREDQTPACAQTCPTTSIKFGDHDEMVRLARERLEVLHAQGHPEARLYGTNPDDGVGGTGSVFLLMDEPEAYGLPPDPIVTTAVLPKMFTMAGIAGTALIGAVLAAFAGGVVRR
ncbi:4Fe-4S dicluster domain-containing protein [Naumannella sp. ID2617S]|uniref:Ferredoxin n=1 Tax=Enemella dayhoffiae TaxID=2016507 RepID=A0A255H0D4_9ACTN|nr:4Fe-4S dicluster domain-containing protein [Enemella dayhoffiae]NNG20182.1 4Fe-4S dicluster domain-containing protein [Naumannella sp. ID2617S]OYO20766.1 ferredoxin [Enemella dayhoffiae]